jgi:hypothetical protein
MSVGVWWQQVAQQSSAESMTALSPASEQSARVLAVPRCCACGRQDSQQIPGDKEM